MHKSLTHLNPSLLESSKQKSSCNFKVPWFSAMNKPPQSCSIIQSLWSTVKNVLFSMEILKSLTSKQNKNATLLSPKISNEKPCCICNTQGNHASPPSSFKAMVKGT